MLSALFSNIGTTALVILFFGGSIFVHELGHFFAARRRGLKVERFSLGFGPKIWSWRGKDGVEYRISWIPLGGYVALPQLADMQAIEGASETPVEQLPSIDYASKMIVSVAGAAMNVVFAFLLACIIWVIGVPTSIGYGACFHGLSSLLSMLNSCASGVSVVNIDNGFGAGYLASMINHMGGKQK